MQSEPQNPQPDCHCPRQGLGLCSQEQGGDREGAPGKGHEACRPKGTREEAIELEGKGGQGAARGQPGGTRASGSVPVSAPARGHHSLPEATETTERIGGGGLQGLTSPVQASMAPARGH